MIWVVDPVEKAKVVEDYKVTLGYEISIAFLNNNISLRLVLCSRIDCKHYNFGEGTCPFGTSCFYQHVGHDGVPEEVKLRVVKGDEEGVVIVEAVKLADYIDRWSQR